MRARLDKGGSFLHDNFTFALSMWCGAFDRLLAFRVRLCMYVCAEKEKEKEKGRIGFTLIFGNMMT